MSLPVILLCPPCKDGKNVLEIIDGFGNFKRGATSRHIRKNGSWSIAHGIRQGMLFWPLNISGKLLLKHGAASIAGNADLPMQSSPIKPKVARA